MTSGVYRYRLYDLTVATDTELSLTAAGRGPDSEPTDDDWWFETGDVEASEGRLVHDVADFTGDRRLEVRVESGGGIVFSHGDTRIEWNSEARHIRLQAGEQMEQRPSVMLERVVAPIALIVERPEFVAFHASAVYDEGGARLFIGDSGAGKSTTALELMRRGRPLLADDLVMVDAEADRLLAATPTVRLFDRPDEVPEAVDDELVMPEREKYWYRLPDRDDEISGCQIRGIYSLEPDDQVDEPVVEKLRGREATVRVVGQAFDLTDADGDWRTSRFRTLCEIARNIPVHRVVYAPDDRRAPAQVDALAAHIGDSGAA